MNRSLDAAPEGGVIPVAAYRWIGAGVVFLSTLLQAAAYWSNDVIGGMVG